MLTYADLQCGDILKDTFGRIVVLVRNEDTGELLGVSISEFGRPDVLVRKLIGPGAECIAQNFEPISTGHQRDAQDTALATAEAWLDRWAAHVGSCKGGEKCTCGLTAVLHEVRGAKGEN